jgi:TonB family protein
VATIIALHGIHIKLNLVAMKKHFVYVIGSLMILISPCVQGQSLVALKLLKSSIDIQLNSSKSKPTVIVKTSNNKLIQIKNKDWPDSVVTTYNILKDVSGKVIAFSEEPNIESGDDSFQKTYYFDSYGKTFAVELFHGRIDNDGQGATGGAIRGTETMYYDGKFNLIYKTERFTDGNNKQIKKISSYLFALDSITYPNKNLCLKHIYEGNKLNQQSVASIAQSNDSSKITQITNDAPDPYLIYTTFDVAPEYPGGNTSFTKFISDNLKYPKEAIVNNISGMVVIIFVVERDGSLGEFKVIRSPGGGCDEEAIRILKLSPKWSPALLNGFPVRAQFTLPINFNSSNTN